MPRQHLIILALGLTSAPLLATHGQGFEGRLTMAMTDSTLSTVEWTIKGKMSHAAFAVAGMQGSSTSVTYLIDNTALTNTVLVRSPGMTDPQGAMLLGYKMVSSLKAAAAGAGDATPTPAAKPKKLTTSETIAGMRCDNYILPDSAKTRACLATGLGRFVYPMLATAGRGGGRGPGGRGGLPPDSMGGGRRGFGGDTTGALGRSGRGGRGAVIGDTTGAGGGRQAGGRGGRGGNVGDSTGGGRQGGGRGAGGPGGPPGAAAAEVPAWALTLGDAGFPLRVWAANGKLVLEVTEITKAVIPAAKFDLPEGYQDAATMGGRGGGFGGGGRGGGGGG